MTPHDSVAPPPPRPTRAGVRRRNGCGEDFPILAERIHGKPLVYLDNAATTQKPQAVLDAMDALLRHAERQHAPRRRTC